MSDKARTQEAFSLALSQHNSGNLALAKASCLKLLKKDKKNSDCLHLLALIAYQESSFDEAQSLVERALAIQPDMADYWSNYGLILQTMGNLSEAMVAFERALELNPVHQNALFNLASSYLQAKYLQKAEITFQMLLNHYPDHVKGLNNFGALLKSMNRLDEAQGCFQSALTLNKNYQEAEWNASFTAFLQEEYDMAWQHFHARWVQTGVAEQRHYHWPQWQGEALSGKRLLVWGEQGIGDQVMFAQAFLDLRESNAEIWAEVEPRLVPIFQRSFPYISFLPKTNEPHTSISEKTFDWQVSLGDLIAILRKGGKASFPQHQGYLVAKKCPRNHFDSSTSDNKIKIGLSWHTNNLHTGNERSIALKNLLPMLEVENIDWVNLQYGDHKAEIETLPETIKANWFEAAVDPLGDLDAFCSLINACDWVISIDNSTAHLASGLGQNSIILLPFSPDWRWQVQSKNPIWYPKSSLIRQNTPFIWSKEIKELRDFCQALAA